MSAQHLRPNAALVYVIDDDADVRESLVSMLESVGYSVGSFALADEFLSQASTAEPSAVLVDLLLPGMMGLDLCREIISRELPCEFAVISGHADVPSTVDAMRLGAVDLLEKPFSKQRLLTTVDRALQNARTKFKKRASDEEVTRRLTVLSPREREIFCAVAEGLVTKEIATRFGISARTVDVHRSRIKQKLGVESPLQLANFLALYALKFSPMPAEANLPRPHILRTLTSAYNNLER